MMKLYHGSPQKLEIILPQKAKGLNKFQNQEAVFLTDSFAQAALYAFGKSLKGKTSFSLPPGKLVILGDISPDPLGYVYECDLPEEKVSQRKGSYEYSYSSPITDFTSHTITLSDYQTSIFHVDTAEELKKGLEKK